MSGILIYADTAALAAEMRTAANVIANGAPVKLLACSCDAGVDSAEVADTYKVEVEAPDVASLASAVANAASALDCDVVILACNRRGKDLSGRVAQKMNAGVITGISKLQFEDGKAIASYSSLGGAVVNRSAIATANKVFCIAPNNFEPCAKGSFSVEDLQVEIEPAMVKIGAARPKEGSAVDVAASDILVVVGCGVEDQNALPQIEALATKLNGVVGCTKPVATDRKWFSEDRIIGISGKTCKPRLAVLLGISGQVQFWAGIREAETIVSINNDKNSGIVSMVDASYVGDAVEGASEFASLV